jgi:hypothetical protein
VYVLIAAPLSHAGPYINLTWKRVMFSLIPGDTKSCLGLRAVPGHLMLDLSQKSNSPRQGHSQLYTTLVDSSARDSFEPFARATVLEESHSFILASLRSNSDHGTRQVDGLCCSSISRAHRCKSGECGPRNCRRRVLGSKGTRLACF